MLLYHGRILSTALRRAQATEDEVRASVRVDGLVSLAAVEVVVIKTDGSFSVVRISKSSDRSSLDGVLEPRANSDAAKSDIAPYRNRG